MTLCDACRYKKAVTAAGKIVCMKKGTKHARAHKCNKFKEKEE